MTILAAILPALISAGVAAIGGMVSTHQQAQQQRARAETAQDQIDEIRADRSILNRAVSAANQVGAAGAARGLAGSGTFAGAAAEAVGNLVADDTARRQSLIAQILAQSGGVTPDQVDTSLGNVLLGGLAAGAGGAGSGIGAIMSTPEGAQQFFDALGIGSSSDSGDAGVVPPPPPPPPVSFDVNTNDGSAFGVGFNANNSGSDFSNFGVQSTGVTGAAPPPTNPYSSLLARFLQDQGA